MPDPGTDTTIEKFSIGAVYAALLSRIDEKEEEIVATLNKMSGSSETGTDTDESDTQLQMELQIQMNEWNVIYSTLSNVIKATVEAMRTCYSNIK